MRRRFARLTAALLCTLWVPLATFAQTQDPPTLVVGWTEIRPLFEATPDGNAGGFGAVAMRLIANKAGLSITFKEFPDAESMIIAQSKGETDLLPGIAALPLFQENNIFSQPIAETSIRVFVRAEDVGTLDPATMTNVPIAVPSVPLGPEGEEMLARNTPIDTPVGTTSITELLRGTYDALVASDSVTLSDAAEMRLDHRIVAVGAHLRTFDRVVVINKQHAALAGPVNQAIEALEADGTLEQLRAVKRVSVPPPPPEVLSVGVYHFPPFQIVNPDGTFTGFSVETIRDLADRAGLALEFKEIDIEEWGRGPGPGRYDLLPQAGINEERQTRMEFSLPIESAPFSIFTRTGDSGGISGLDDLVGQRVGVQKDNLAARMAWNHRGLNVVETEDKDDLLDALLDGRADAILYPTRAVREQAEARGIADQIAEVETPFFISHRAPALRFGLGEVRERLNAVTPGYLISEDFTRLRSQYFGTVAFWTRERFVWFGVLGGTLTLSLLSVAGYLQLRTRSQAAREQSRQAAQVEAVRRELETVIHAANSGIIALDAKGKVVRINNMARHMLGGISDPAPFFWPGHIKFLDAETLQPLDDSADPIRRALSGHRLQSEIHLMRRVQKGEDGRYVRIGSGRLETPESGVSVVLIIDDVSNEERNRQVVERKGRLDALGQLTGGIAHDFNNLLASMVYALDLARRAPSAEKRTHYITVASQSIDRGRELTKRLLAFAKRQPGLATSKPIDRILGDFEKLMRPMIEANTELLVTVEEEDMQVYCDHAQLETALLNLVLNSRDAIRQSGQGDCIRIQARPVRTTELDMDGNLGPGREPSEDGSSYRFIEIAVSDNGPGMDAETRSRAIDPFFTTKDINSGTGLGLSMVYGFVRQADGDIRIYSELGVGTTVRLTLPRGTESGVREAPMPVAEPARGSGQSILLAEDELALLKMMQTILQDLGYRVEAFPSGDDALEAIEAGNSYDLLLTDVVMPGKLGGFELAQRVRALRPGMPVIYMSGYTGFTASEMGAVQAPLLQKPVPSTELAEAIGLAIEASSTAS